MDHGEGLHQIRKS